jgi:hypothetical protein
MVNQQKMARVCSISMISIVLRCFYFLGFFFRYRKQKAIPAEGSFQTWPRKTVCSASPDLSICNRHVAQCCDSAWRQCMHAFAFIHKARAYEKASAAATWLDGKESDHSRGRKRVEWRNILQLSIWFSFASCVRFTISASSVHKFWVMELQRVVGSPFFRLKRVSLF